MAVKSQRECEAEVRSWGFSHVYTWADGPNAHYTPHSHRGLTTHLILKGQLTITYSKEESPEKKTYGVGDRIDVGANVVHEPAVRTGTSAPALPTTSTPPLLPSTQPPAPTSLATSSLSQSTPTQSLPSFPHAGGSVFIILEIGPNANNEEFLHRTKTVDYVHMMDGELELGLDGEEKRLVKKGKFSLQVEG